MYFFEPVKLSDHDAVLGTNFSQEFANQMSLYYAPFRANPGRPMQLAKETWEYAVADAIPNAEWSGAGKSVVDVRAPGGDIDVKGISIDHMDDTLTTEASILQNNRRQNNHILQLFENRNLAPLKTMFVDEHSKKIDQTKNLHLLAIIREKSLGQVYYTLLKIVPSTLSESEIINQMILDGETGVTVPMIDPQYGKTYIYAPKRRLEIRLNVQGLKDYLVHSHSY